ncbi:MAG: 6-carboxytetrahydropterin synthase QueD, partial [Chitinivibrionales bacterium]|nr:6-carboxytetrahydropterin synthase QueD [Chitinivibrionales bacterium]MBD3395575.1 6-carboxytetrahydropterin synthase QueD [Chitinivibrionales bacterium]
HHLRNYRGPCENIHGHNWRVRAFVRGEDLNELGIAIDFKALKAHMATVVEPLDHADLNAFFDALNINPSSENLARYVYKELERALASTPCAVSRVEVYETPTNCAAYFEHA